MNITGADDDRELKKEIAVNDRMCPCAARWSMIAIGMYLCMWERSVIAIAVIDRMCPCAARWSMIAIGMYLCMCERSAIAIKLLFSMCSQP